MKRLVALIAMCLALAACVPGDPVAGGGFAASLNYVHDEAHAVGCWIYSGHGVFCLPDKDYTK